MLGELLNHLSTAFGRPRVVEHQWGLPYELDCGSIQKAVVAMDARGRGLAVWENKGTLWSTPLSPAGRSSLTRFPVAAGHNPCISINGKGKGMLLWESGRDQVMAAPLCVTASIGSGHALDVRGRVNHLQVAVDRRGGAIALWCQAESGCWELRVQTFDARTQSWEPASTRLGRPSKFPLAPRLLMNAKGLAMAIWHVEEEDFSGPVVVYNWPTEGIWSDHPVPIAECKTSDLVGAVDEGGNAFVCWVRQTHGEMPTLEAIRFSGNSCEWTLPQPLALAPRLFNLELGATGEGEAILVWRQTENSGITSILGRHYRRGAWDEEALPFDAGIRGTSQFSIVKAFDHTTVLIIPQAGKPIVYENRGNQWLSPISLEWPGREEVRKPVLATSAHGTLALWLSGTQDQVQLMVCGAS